MKKDLQEDPDKTSGKTHRKKNMEDVLCEAHVERKTRKNNTVVEDDTQRRTSGTPT
jgi:hypothetical protein